METTVELTPYQLVQIISGLPPNAPASTMQQSMRTQHAGKARSAKHQTQANSHTAAY